MLKVLNESWKHACEGALKQNMTPQNARLLKNLQTAQFILQLCESLPCFDARGCHNTTSASRQSCRTEPGILVIPTQDACAYAHG